MDNLSDSFKSEFGSVTSTDSLNLTSDEFRFRHASTPDVSNVELSKRVALLELENERLRIDLENNRIELNARIAANEGLKGKISELYVELQTAQQEKQKLFNSLSDTTSRLTTLESSTKWYQSQFHNLQASHKVLQIEVNAHHRIARQRQNAVNNMTNKCKELANDYSQLMRKSQQEKQELNQKVRFLESKSSTDSPETITAEPLPDLSTKLEVTEGELQDTKIEIKALEQQLLSSEVAKISMEGVINKQQILISDMEKNIQNQNSEKNELTKELCKLEFEMQKVITENESLKSDLASTKLEQSQIEDATTKLRLQLNKMIAQYKLIKSRNAEVEEKLNSMGDITEENKRLKQLSYEANRSLVRKLTFEKRKIKSLQTQLQNEQSKVQFLDMKNKTETSLRSCLKQALIRNKDLQSQLKVLTKNLDESMDEGYDGSSTLSSVSTDIPMPIADNSALLNTAEQLIAQCKNFSVPLDRELNNLKTKFDHIQQYFSQNKDVQSL